MTMGHNKADRGKGVALRLGREDPGGAGGSRARPDQRHPVYKTGAGGACDGSLRLAPEPNREP